MTTFDERIAAAGITAKVEETTGRVEAPHGYPLGSRSWRVTLRGSQARRSIVVPFFTGPAIADEPTAADVLDCLVSNAAGYINAESLEDWASEYGIDADAGETRQTYRDVKESTEKLQRLLAEYFDDFLWNTEPY